MNFGREGVLQKQEQLRPARHAGVIAVLIFIALFMTALVVVTSLGLGAVNGIIAGAPAI